MAGGVPPSHNLGSGTGSLGFCIESDEQWGRWQALGDGFLIHHGASQPLGAQGVGCFSMGQGSWETLCVWGYINV